MKKILDVTNLLGDSLYALKPVEQFMQKYPEEVASIVAHKGLAFELFHNCFADKVPVYDSQEISKDVNPDAMVLRLSAGPSAELAFAFSRHPQGRQLHISEGYAKLLGFDLADGIRPPSSWFRAQDAAPLEECILLSPFSRSDTFWSGGPRNKTLDDWKWEHIVRFLRKQGYPIKVLGSPDDYLKCTIPTNDYITAQSLYHLEHLLRSCKMLVTIDNGIGHVAANLDVRTIHLWPKAASFDFIGPKYGRRSTFIHMDALNAAPIGIMVGFRRFTQLLLDGQYNETLEEVAQG